MKEYRVRRYKNQQSIDWEEIDVLQIQEYPWYKSGLKQDTDVRIAITDNALHIKVDASDIHSSAVVVERNGSVYLDSCFEFFVTPQKELSASYINFEISCIGTLYLAVRNEKGKRRATNLELDQVGIITSMEQKKVKSPQTNDLNWNLLITIPLEFLSEFYNNEIDASIWYGNFYRCGGSIDDQYAVWNNIEAKKPDFHQPFQFGKIILE